MSYSLGGSFAYGPYGFLYKKKAGGGGRRSTRNIPGGGALSNRARFTDNQYKPGESGVGAQSTAVRRAKNIRASVCTPGNKCDPVYNRLGVNQYNNLGETPSYPAYYYIYHPLSSANAYGPPPGLVLPTSATQPAGIAQLSDNYNATWAVQPAPDTALYTMVRVIRLWQYTTVGDVYSCRGYYRYIFTDTPGVSGYWNSLFTYNANTGLWTYILASGNPASETSDGLPSNDGNTYKVIYSQPH